MDASKAAARSVGRRTALCAALGLLAVVGFRFDAAAGAMGRGAAPDEVSRLVETAALVGPVGINPFLALAGLGLAAQAGAWTPPGELDVLGHTAVWVGLLVVGLLIKLGRSTKITKPLAEAIGTGESLLALGAFALAVVPLFQEGGVRGGGPGPVEAGVGEGVVVMTVGMLTLGVVIAVRTALDVLIWLAPFPFVDALFQGVKAVVTAGLLVLVVYSPWLALAATVVLFVAAALALRWAIRTVRCGGAVVWDVTFGRLGPRLEMPRDPVAREDLGPFVVFALEVPGVATRARGELRLQAGRWVLTSRTLWGGLRETPLGDADVGSMAKGWLGIEVAAPGGRVLLPGRYMHLAETLVQETGAKSPAVIAAFRSARAGAS